MAKVTGLNVRLYVEGYDLSGDANALSGLGYTNELLDVTTLDVSARKRIIGMRPPSSTPSGRPTLANSRRLIRGCLSRWVRRLVIPPSG